MKNKIIDSDAKIAQAVSDALSSDDTPQKERRVLCKILAPVMHADGFTQRKFRKAAGSRQLHFKHPGSASSSPGRPKGSFTVSDAELERLLQPLSADSSIMHPTLEKPIRTLSASKRRCAREVQVLKKSQLALRLRRCRLAFAPAGTQRGKCDACHSWLGGGRKQLSMTVTEGLKSIAFHMPSYFVRFHEENPVADPIRDRGL